MLSEASMKAIEGYWEAAGALQNHNRDRRFDAAYDEATRLNGVGNGVGAYWLGRLLVEGNGTERDIPKAVLLLERADAMGVFQASRLLATLHYSGDVLPQDRELSRRFAVRAFSLDLEISEWKADSLRPRLGLFHPSGEAVWYRFWSQRAVFLKGEANAAKLRALRKELDLPPFDTAKLAFNSLPNECRPKSPPWAMRRLKVDQVSGDVIFRLNDIGRADGIYVARISDSRFTAAAFDLFFYALTSHECALSIPDKLSSYQVPFLFRFD